MANSSLTYGLSGLQIGLGLLEGKAKSDLYKLEAEEVGLQAKASELARRQELQDALAMQAVIVGASGRAGGEGSVQQIIQEDKRRAGRDIGMIKAGAEAKKASLRGAGRMAKTSSITSGLLSASKTISDVAKIGKSEKKQVK